MSSKYMNTVDSTSVVYILFCSGMLNRTILDLIFTV